MVLLSIGQMTEEWLATSLKIYLVRVGSYRTFIGFETIRPPYLIMNSSLLFL
jgi:hypothetical protein